VNVKIPLVFIPPALTAGPFDVRKKKGKKGKRVQKYFSFRRCGAEEPKTDISTSFLNPERDGGKCGFLMGKGNKPDRGKVV